MWQPTVGSVCLLSWTGPRPLRYVTRWIPGVHWHRMRFCCCTNGGAPPSGYLMYVNVIRFSQMYQFSSHRVNMLSGQEQRGLCLCSVVEAVSPPVTWKTPVRFPHEVPLTLRPTRSVVGLIPLWPSLITHCLYICLPYRRSWVRAPGEPCTWCSRSAVNTTISSVGSIKFSLFF